MIVMTSWTHDDATWKVGCDVSCGTASLTFCTDPCIA